VSAFDTLDKGMLVDFSRDDECYNSLTLATRVLIELPQVVGVLMTLTLLFLMKVCQLTCRAATSDRAFLLLQQEGVE
jgi:hypothetical protein